MLYNEDERKLPPYRYTVGRVKEPIEITEDGVVTERLASMHDLRDATMVNRMHTVNGELTYILDNENGELVFQEND